MEEKKNIAILGSTGSIGTQALQVIDEHPDKFCVEVLTSNNNSELLIRQALKYMPNAVVIANDEKYNEVKNALSKEDIKVYAGKKSVAQIVETDKIDMVLTALVGFSGLEPTVNAIKNKKHIALANKETLVVAGDLITKLAKENAVNIYPVDSEHSAIFQCMAGEWQNPIEKIYLTASGGPFRGMKKEQLEKVTLEQALKHPNWSMGEKITIDSATLMNKGFEVIEAKWLFNLKPEQIDIIIHPQSIIHSIVQFTDGSMKAQMGLPDMKLPIQYAFSYPQRISSASPRLDFTNFPKFTFEQADKEAFLNLRLAFQAMEKGGNTPCILNAANEITVDAFLNKKISFLDIARINEKVMNVVEFIAKPNLSDYFETNTKSREFALKLL